MSFFPKTFHQTIFPGPDSGVFPRLRVAPGPRLPLAPLGACAAAGSGARAGLADGDADGRGGAQNLAGNGWERGVAGIIINNYPWDYLGLLKRYQHWMGMGEWDYYMLSFMIIMTYFPLSTSNKS